MSKPLFFKGTISTSYASDTRQRVVDFSMIQYANTDTHLLFLNQDVKKIHTYLGLSHLYYFFPSLFD